MQLPEKIKTLIGSQKYKLDTIGLSQATVQLFEDQVLKIQKESEEADHEVHMMEWLKGKLPVPEVICHEKQEGMQYLLMSRLPGVMSCHPSYMEDPVKLTEQLAAGLKMLWQVDISDCPYESNLEKKLQMAKYNVEHHLVNLELCEPDTFGEGGFRNPEHLLAWLMEHKPEEDYVLSHGDYCLPNIFMQDDAVSGFLDLGKTGIGDRYQDIALCYRSLIHNYQGKYSSRTYEAFYPKQLFEQLGVEPDWEKVRYYILLDELF